MADRQVVYVSGYPKSGTTFLTRLLGDVLNSPTGGCMPSEDHKEIATEGQDRSGLYIIRKGHFVLIDDNTGPVIPSPHRMAWKQLADEKIVFLVRDPRDICVSGAYHWRVTPAEFLDRMIKGNVAKCGRWDEYVNRWLQFAKSNKIAVTKYEDLLERTANHIYRIMKCVIPFDADEGNYDLHAIWRQSFASRSKGLDEKEMRRNNMRKGVVGDWRNHFTTEMNDKIWNEFGWIMERLGYGSDN